MSEPKLIKKSCLLVGMEITLPPNGGRTPVFILDRTCFMARPKSLASIVPELTCMVSPRVLGVVTMDTVTSLFC